MALATVEMVETDLGRDLDENETARAVQLLADAETLIRTRVSSLDSKIAADPVYGDLVAMVEKNAVARTLRNPDGYRQESEGNYSYSIDSRAAAGFLTILETEWRLLTGGGAFTINPYHHAASVPAQYWDRDGTPHTWGWFV